MANITKKNTFTNEKFLKENGKKYEVIQKITIPEEEKKEIGRRKIEWIDDEKNEEYILFYFFEKNGKYGEKEITEFAVERKKCKIEEEKKEIQKTEKRKKTGKISIIDDFEDEDIFG